MLEARHAGGPAAESRVLDLSIVIVTWNSERWIERCLRSIPAACDGLRYEVVIHDNASADATVSLAKDGGAPARVYADPENRGFAAASNRAIAESTGRHVFLLNPDCALEPRALTILVEYLDRHPEAAAVVPHLIEESGSSQRDFQLRRLPTLRTLAAEVLMVDKLFPRNSATASYRYHDLELDAPRQIEQPAAAALLLRRCVVEEIGPFDEQFAPAWFEDVDYCRRLAEQKKQIWIVPAAHARHFGGASLEHLDHAAFLDIWYRNMWRYARKWMRPAQAEALRWTIIFGMILRCVAGVAGIRPKGISRRDALRAWSTVLKKAFDRWM